MSLERHQHNYYNTTAIKLTISTILLLISINTTNANHNNDKNN